MLGILLYAEIAGQCGQMFQEMLENRFTPANADQKRGKIQSPTRSAIVTDTMCLSPDCAGPCVTNNLRSERRLRL